MPCPSFIKDNQWVVSAEFVAHQIGCNAVSWAPSAAPSSLISISGAAAENYIKRLATGGSDNLIKIWKYVIFEAFSKPLPFIIFRLNVHQLLTL